MGRVKSRNGCVTCRRRRKKCGEEKPICSHCKRLKLFCSYNAAYRGTSREIIIESRLPLQMGAVASIAPESVFIGDFHRLPVSDTQRKEVVDLCFRLASSLMTNVWPFSLNKVELETVRNGWLGPSFSNGTQLCLSVAALSAGIQARGELNSDWHLIRARYESESLGMMRSRLKASQPGVPDFVAMICAAHLPITAVSRDVTDIQLGKLAEGARNLSRQFGGVRTFLAMQAYHVVEILVRAEWIACIVIGEASVMIRDFEQPIPPESCLNPAQLVLPDSVGAMCDAPLIELVQSIKVLLHYRVNQDQHNICSSVAEYYYLTNLLNQVSLQLTHIQSIHRGSATTRECVTYALILLRVDVLGHRWLHPRLGDQMCSRFFDAISQTDSALWGNDGALEMLMWVLGVGAVLCHDATMRRYFYDRLIAILPDVFPLDDRMASFDIVSEVEGRFWLVAWHASLSRALREILRSDEQPTITSLCVDNNTNGCV